jgi:primosomal protein N' (replication factor Y)
MSQGKPFAAVSPLAVPVDATYDYSVPLELRGKLRAGDMVTVPFRNRTIFAVVVKLKDTPEVARVKPIAGRVDDFRTFPPDLMHLCLWVSQVFLCSMRAVLDTVFPFQKSMRQRGFEADAYRTLKRRLVMNKVINLKTDAVERARERDFPDLKRAKSQRAVLYILHDAGGAMPLSELLKTANTSKATVDALIDKGYAALDFIPAHMTVAGEAGAMEQQHTLSPEQEVAYQKITHSVTEGRHEEFLLHGITGSGKTEVYMHAAAECIAQGRTVLVLIPEIALSTQIIQRFLRRYIGRIAVWHSMLNLTERLYEWERIAAGQVDIVIGARSAVFAPLINLGLVIVDEEQEAAYKQDSFPRYHGRQAAIERAKAARCPVVLGSATPSVGSFFNVRRGRATLLTLPARAGDSELPDIRLIDMKKVYKKRTTSTFSPQMLIALKENLERGEQSMVFLNHRGYSQYVQCFRCGESLVCPECSISLKYHKAADTLKCHICDVAHPLPAACPHCGSKGLLKKGLGTEKVFGQLKRYFKDARIERMDRDTTTRRGEYQRIIKDMEDGNIDILVGTQMIAKGLDFAGVTLVGVVSADSIINLPDFRASERTYQLLTQVAGRAGRGDKPGNVIVQTLTPEHPAIYAACTHDYQKYYDYELEMRKAGRFPPYTRIINCIISHEDQHQARDLAYRLEDLFVARIEAMASDRFKGIMGPSEAPFYKLHGKYRWFTGIRGTSLNEILSIVDTSHKLLTGAEQRCVAVDVFPANML